MDLIETILASWGFTGLDPVRIVARNAFGNVIVEASDASYWRICPEDVSCKPIAASADELEQLRSSAEFDHDWQMAPLIAVAQAKLGVTPEGRCYCLKIPAVLGGDYSEENLGTIELAELLSVSGSIARQIQDLPDGTRVRLVVLR